MQITPLPKDASAGISSLLHQGHRPAVGASSLRLHHLWKWLPSTLQRTSARLSCDHMLPQPSACSQPALPPEFSLPEGCGLLRRAAAGGTAHTDCPGSPTLCSGLEGTRTCLFCPLTKIASSWVTENRTKQNKQKIYSHWWYITSPDLLLASLDLHDITA